MASPQDRRRAQRAGGKKGKSPQRLGGRGGLGAASKTKRSMGPVGASKKPAAKYTTTFHESKKAALKDKGKPNTPGEKGRTFKGKVTMGRIRSKKMLRGDFDIGKKIRYQRRGK